jgi:hypothetical protein
MKRKNDKMKEKIDDLQKSLEKIGIAMREAMKEKQNKMRKGNDIFVKRMMIVKFDANEKGKCDNVSKGEKRPIVTAGDTICGVGMIRRGRNWGDYGGVFCCECPYFIPKIKEKVALEMRR